MEVASVWRLSRISLRLSLNHGLTRIEISRALHKNRERCHGLVPWSFTLVATSPHSSISVDATALGRGGSRSQLNSNKRETPRGKPVASVDLEFWIHLATNVRFHGTSPWHLEFLCKPVHRVILLFGAPCRGLRCATGQGAELISEILDRCESG